jgi:hypothetical protein
MNAARAREQRFKASSRERKPPLSDVSNPTGWV